MIYFQEMKKFKCVEFQESHVEYEKSHVKKKKSYRSLKVT